MAQLVVNDDALQAFEGMVHDRPERIESGIASALIYFGKACSQSLTVAIDEVTPNVNLYTGTEKFAGIAIADTSIETISPDYGGYVAETAVPLLKKGRIWVVTGDTITDLSTSVWVRNANPGVSPPAESLGSFRGTTATDYIDLGAIADVKWRASASIGGVDFGLLSINEG